MLLEQQEAGGKGIAFLFGIVIFNRCFC